MQADGPLRPAAGSRHGAAVFMRDADRADVQVRAISGRPWKISLRFGWHCEGVQIAAVSWEKTSAPL